MKLSDSAVFWGVVFAAVAFTISMLVFAPLAEGTQALVTLPAVGSLSIALLNIWSEREAARRSKDLQSRQQTFTLGAMSHMANVVFDKHVDFGEKYLAEVHEALVTLWRHGPTQEALRHANNLYKIRVEYAAWITPSIEEKLTPFEQTFRSLGANHGLVEAMRTEADKNGLRAKALDEMYSEFKKVLGFSEKPKSSSKDKDFVARVKEVVAEILQLDQLIEIRENLIRAAADSVRVNVPK